MPHYKPAVELTHPYPGAVAALEALRAKGHRLGICTNKPFKPTMVVLRHLGLERYFETVIGGDSLSVHKPDPAPLEKAFADLEAGARVFVGDSDVDAATAQAVDVTFFLFTEGYRKVPVAELPHDHAFSQFEGFAESVEAAIATLDSA